MTLPGDMASPALDRLGPPVTATLVKPLSAGLTAKVTLLPLCVAMILLPAIRVAVPPGATPLVPLPLATPDPAAAVARLTPAPAA